MKTWNFETRERETLKRRNFETWKRVLVSPPYHAEAVQQIGHVMTMAYMLLMSKLKMEHNNNCQNHENAILLKAW